MHIETTREDTLHRHFTISFDEKAYNAKVDERLTALKSKVNVPGFRPGKVPLSVMRQRFADRIHGEVVEQTVDSVSQQVLQDHGLRPAMQPKVSISEFDPKKGLTFTLEVVLSPEFDLMDVKSLTLPRYVITPEEKEINATLERLQRDMRTSKPVAKKRKAKKDDLVIIDFVGRIDGEEFDGGSAEDFRLELGSGQMIQGFEDQIIGMSKGDSGDITVTFPADYQAENLAGKEAVFTITLKDVHDFVLPDIDDAMAKHFGADDLETLKQQMNTRLANQYMQMSEDHLRRELFDQLNSGHDMELADEMLDAEYTQLEGDYKQAREQGRLAPEEMAQPEEEALAELKMIASRRVRLALVLAKYGEKFQVEVTDDDLRQQLMSEARQYPGQEQAFIQHIQQNQQAQEQMRARAKETAIVRVLVELINPEEKQVSLAEFEQITAALDAQTSGKSAPKKTSGKKTSAKKKSATKKETTKKETTKKETAKDSKKAADKKASAKKKANADKP